MYAVWGSSWSGMNGTVRQQNPPHVPRVWYNPEQWHRCDIITYCRREGAADSFGSHGLSPTKRSFKWSSMTFEWKYEQVYVLPLSQVPYYFCNSHYPNISIQHSLSFPKYTVLIEIIKTVSLMQRGISGLSPLDWSEGTQSLSCSLILLNIHCERFCLFWIE